MDHQECHQHLNAIEDAVYVIGGKWKLRIILSLQQQALRFNEIQREVGGISAKVLSNELKDLEENGFVKRREYPGFPMKVVYELTDYSNSLKSVMIELSQWGRSHKEFIKRNHQA
ncbi:winged helix-turn-helix transcriptional regulator [Flavilitoribacter nigricans]|uniref:Transcriptional regulator n=1 Tax=Flavilitoribacter nigricans (strain ATCC 23147 / DSM 23189 / NBRC 102662 / NCIMB 1420 / SS-2) TaxID=1122177 RepID=A0A2D0MZL9_FLAN2|nr:helix-turn-helix domain-containing protein [Flavilitoribacter nigricans]PHN01578.1 transcriptional regulator [Flavilitoribacter nigricans DSM 23189 = NBRC 102662]